MGKVQGICILSLLCIFFVGTCAHGGPRYNSMQGDNGNFRADWVIYEEDEVEYANFSVRAKITGWVGIGFTSTESLSDAEYDIIIGYLPYNVTDRYTKEDEFVEDTKLNGTNDVTDVSAEQSGDFTVVTFTRKLDTGDQYDYNFESEGDVVIKWAYGTLNDDGFLKLTASGKLTMNFFTSQETSDEFSQLKAHGIMMAWVVMILMTSGMVLSRYLKTVFYYWFYVHAAVFCASLIFIMVSTIVIFNAHQNRFEPSWHSAFGIMFIIVMGSQSALGLLSHLRFDLKRSAPPLFPDKVHWWLGRTSFLIGIIAVSLGLAALPARQLAWNSFLIWGVVCAILVLAMEKYVGQTHEVLLKGIAEDDEAFADLHDDDDYSVYVAPKRGRSLSDATKPVSRDLLRRVLGFGTGATLLLFILVAVGISTSNLGEMDDMD